VICGTLDLLINLKIFSAAAATRTPEDDVTLLAPDDLFAVIDLYQIQMSDNK
jgi:hypothetical protein